MSRRIQGVVWLLALVIVLGVAAFYSRGIAATYAQSRAIELASNWKFSPAIVWLQRAQWLDPDNAESYLLEARCRWILGRQDLWQRRLQVAKSKGLAKELLSVEDLASQIPIGNVPEDIEPIRVRFVQAGYTHQQVTLMLARGYLAVRDNDRAKLLLQQWEALDPDSATLQYVWAHYYIRLGQPDAAEQRLLAALEKQPDHELARMLLAELYDTQKRLDESLAQYAELARCFPTSDVARIGMAGILREMTRTADAKRVLAPILERKDRAPGAMLERTQIALDEGHYAEVDKWLADVPLDQIQHYGTLATASVMYGIQGDIIRALRLNRRGESLDATNRRMEDLRTHLLFEPGDQAAAAEFQRLSMQRRPVMELGPRVPWEPIFEDVSEKTAQTGPELFTVHCSVCHGGDGAGDGRAAQHVFPRPRDFRNDRFRLVSAVNGVPTVEDLVRVIRLGMPGTSMPAYEALTDEQCRLIGEEVLRLHRAGLRDQFIALLERQDDEVDEEEVRDVVESRTTPRNPVHVPDFPVATAAMIERGREIFLQQGCDKCHGADGIGAADSILYDDLGEPTRARDLMHEPFKGGQSPADVYRRLATGMPGTPHPATADLSAKDHVALVRFVLSLGKSPQRLLGNYEREKCALTPAYLREYPPAQHQGARAPTQGDN